MQLKLNAVAAMAISAFCAQIEAAPVAEHPAIAVPTDAPILPSTHVTAEVAPLDLDVSVDVEATKNALFESIDKITALPDLLKAHEGQLSKLRGGALKKAKSELAEKVRAGKSLFGSGKSLFGSLIPRDDPDKYDRVILDDLINENYRLERVAEIRTENPSMALKKEYLDEVTAELYLFANTVSRNEFCEHAEKELSGFELVYKPKQFQKMCDQKYSSLKKEFDAEEKALAEAEKNKNKSAKALAKFEALEGAKIEKDHAAALVWLKKEEKKWGVKQVAHAKSLAGNRSGAVAHSTPSIVRRDEYKKPSDWRITWESIKSLIGWPIDWKEIKKKFTWKWW